MIPLVFRNHNHYHLRPQSVSNEIGVIGQGRMGTDRREATPRSRVTRSSRSTSMRRPSNQRLRRGATVTPSLEEFIATLEPPRYLWLMVPAGEPVDITLDELENDLDPADIVVDGGNSHYADSVRRAEDCPAQYLDCGTSGGPAGADLGFSLMVGGPGEAYEELEPAFNAVATGPSGHAHLGPAGAGHYVKMVHNGVEYALMQAYGEGFELLHEGRYDLDLEAVAGVWNNGAVIRSWLLELCEEAFREEGSDLETVADHVAGGSTGTWTVQEALEQEIPLPIIYTALAERFGSRVPNRFSRQLANRLRYGFGRHEIIRE
ncbi:MAG: NADP-dependent phosphogluconate dehydrogenase [Natrialbaceae archaeon]|nr:NADP-dependent phosphogluconate dehydrogenase [Natrialbaceae archaeon]